MPWQTSGLNNHGLRYHDFDVPNFGLHSVEGTCKCLGYLFVALAKLLNELQPLFSLQQPPGLWVPLQKLLPCWLSLNNYPHAEGCFTSKIGYLNRKMGLVGFVGSQKDGMIVKEWRSVGIGKNGWVIKRIIEMDLTVRRIQTYALIINLVDLAQGHDMTF